jgi:hypothetical protein
MLLLLLLMLLLLLLLRPFSLLAAELSYARIVGASSL